MNTPRRVAAAFAAATALTLVLGACADTSADTDTADAPPTIASEVDSAYNDADVTFAQGMIPHHRQAVQMSELAVERTDTPEVLELSEEISSAQGPEIQTMTAFLEAWGAEVPEDMEMGDMEGMDHGGSDGMDMDMEGMAGMMTPEQMTDLEGTEGADFDQMFLEMMIAHHEGAVEMAQVEIEAGDNPDAVSLAEDIIAAQESEIERMQDLLDAA